ncbi:MarR family protein [Pseudonocardia oroxyli]|uniref:MarR family protein n=2 Tax=Pseudonocardia oroxyli TaxID=366584 RepID=A0A1G7DVP8_PSEOR|nr:MarR family protein [Pseudonocardia oroxyli]
MDRPDKRNAVDAAMTAGLDAALNELEGDPELWCGVLTGGSQMFCAGTDLANGAGAPTERGGNYGVVRRERSTPLVAAVDGIAYGGGFEIVPACDVVVAGRSARFGLPEVSRGVIANYGAGRWGSPRSWRSASRSGPAGNLRRMKERRDELIRLLQAYTTESARLADEFATRHGLHTTDLHALIAVLAAEGRGVPLTAGRLAAHLGLSSGATTALVDRMERHGYVERVRDPADRRRVVLTYGDEAARVGRAFFGPLGADMDALVAGFSDAELAAVQRFLAGVVEMVAARRAAHSSTAISRPSE